MNNLKENLKTHIKNLTQNNMSKLLKTILLSLLLGMVLLFAYTQTAANEDKIVIEKEEIEENSQKYQDLQMNIDSCAGLISEYQREQQELNERNNLLRELFTQGKNQK